LRDDRDTILESTARLSAVFLEEIVHSLSQLRQPAQVVDLCGRNHEGPRVVASISPALPQETPVDFVAIGQTTLIDELMAASDIFVGRPGGLMTAEALACGLVLVVINPLPGEEERNAYHLLEAG